MCLEMENLSISNEFTGVKHKIDVTLAFVKHKFGTRKKYNMASKLRKLIRSKRRRMRQENLGQKIQLLAELEKSLASQILSIQELEEREKSLSSSSCILAFARESSSAS